MIVKVVYFKFFCLSSLSLVGDLDGLPEEDPVCGPHLLARGDDLVLGQEEAVALVAQLHGVGKAGAERTGVPVVGVAGGGV